MSLFIFSSNASHEFIARVDASSSVPRDLEAIKILELILLAISKMADEVTSISSLHKECMLVSLSFDDQSSILLSQNTRYMYLEEL